jgi:3-oxoacyl-[acyl-carrier protein] reductase
MMSLSLDGRIAIVTGGTRGIGHAISEKLAQNGASLIITGTTQLSADNASAELADRYGVEVTGFGSDVANIDDCNALARLAFSKYKRLDILVNNAGIMRDGLISMIKQVDVEDTINVNLIGVLNMIRACARLMERNRSGSIVNMSSIMGVEGNKGQLVYSATKSGVIGATLAAAKELAEKNIRVNAIAPGYIETDLTKSVSPEVHAQRMSSIAMQRIGTPDDVANTTLFLASDLSSYVTGQVIGVDGGMLI